MYCVSNDDSDDDNAMCIYVNWQFGSPNFDRPLSPTQSETSH